MSGEGNSLRFQCFSGPASNTALAEPAPLRDAGALLAPGRVQLKPLDLLDSAFRTTAGLAQLSPRKALHQPQVAVGEPQRSLDPAVDDGQKRFLSDRGSHALSLQRAERAAQARLHRVHQTLDCSLTVV